MAHKQNYLVILCFLFLLASCNTQKKEYQKNVKTVAADIPGKATADENNAIDIAALQDAYTNSITQTFTVKRKKITVLTGKRGLKVTVNPADLETLDGQPVTGDIIVKMVELTTAADLFKSNAATISNGQLLVSGGSYFVGMECNGKELKVKGTHTVQMEFPAIKESDMELFYGKRDAYNNMNWARAEEPLRISQQVQEYNPPFQINYSNMPRFRSKYRMYDSLNTKVTFMDMKMTIKEMVEYLQKKGVDKNIDSLSIAWERFYGSSYYNYDRLPYTYFVKKYRILSCKQIEAEQDSIAKVDGVKLQQEEANRIYNEEWQKRNANNSLEEQLQKYYAPAGVTSLGWINCDRFYNDPQKTDVPVEIPYTLNVPNLQYFLIYKTFNGLMSGRLVKNAQQQYILSNLPRGQAVTLVAFTKNKGQVFHCKQEFVIQPGTKLKPDFKEISRDEMTRMFGANVKI